MFKENVNIFKHIKFLLLLQSKRSSTRMKHLIQMKTKVNHMQTCAYLIYKTSLPYLDPIQTADLTRAPNVTCTAWITLNKHEKGYRNVCEQRKTGCNGTMAQMTK